MDKIRNAVTTGLPTFGNWISLADPVSVELMGKAGFDWVILDTQHGGINWDNLLPSIQALDLGGTRAFVRVGWNDPMQIMRALDLGATGVVVPMVSTPAQAALAAQAVRYPPHGIRSFGKVRSYYSAASGPAPEPLCLVMIETAEAMENLEAIAATPGVDGLFVGPADLAISFGLAISQALQMSDQVFQAVGDVIDTCRRHGIISGSAALGTPNAKLLMDRGMDFIALGSDAGFIRRGAAADIEVIRQWTESRKSTLAKE